MSTSRREVFRKLEQLQEDVIWAVAIGYNNAMDISRLVDAVDGAVKVMTEASDDIKWLKDHPVVREDTEAAAKLDELAGKLEAVASSLKVDTDATNPPEAPKEPVVEEPSVAKEVPTEEVQVDGGADGDPTTEDATVTE
jgi:hypothetical protein